MAIAVGSPRQFGARYREGLFVAFHGSWNRSPLPQAGYRVAWVPFEGGRPTGQYSTFAAGTAGPTSLRASGLATGPDGSLYVAADGNTTIWRIVNSNRAAAQDAAAPTVGQVAPDFSLSAATRDGVRAKPVRLSELRGKTVVLAFFPKARTSGCTIQMTAYRDRYAELFHGGTDVVLLAISADPPEAQASWAKEAGFPFAFLSDANGDAGRLYGAWLPEHKLDKRSLFVVGPDGKISYTQVPFREVDAQAYAELGAAVAQASGAVRKTTKS
jgi:peroxiredoxin Q/BCP